MLRRDQPAGAIAQQYGISEGALYNDHNVTRQRSQAGLSGKGRINWRSSVAKLSDLSRRQISLTAERNNEGHASSTQKPECHCLLVIHVKSNILVHQEPA